MSDVVLVTGASAGLGLALSKLLKDRHFRLVLTARAESLRRFADAGIFENERIRIRALDVTKDEDRRRVVADTTEAWGGVNILINNAGLAFRSAVEDIGPEELQAQLAINFAAPLHLAQLVLPRMRELRRGHIIGVSSVGGMLAMPTLALYSASKYALEGMSEALWYEVRPFGVHVTLIQPGFIRSESFRNTRFTPSSEQGMKDSTHPYHNHYVSMDAFIEKLMLNATASHARVARKILNVMLMKRPPLRIAATPDAVVFALLRRFLPRQIFHEFLYRCLPRVKTWGTKPKGSVRT